MGIQGHRVVSKIRLKIDVKDADGNEPDYPVAIYLQSSGVKACVIAPDPDLPWIYCKEAMIIWHERDSQGVVIPNDEFLYETGIYAWIAGYVPDAASPTGIKPVWTEAETLRIQVRAKLPSGDSAPYLVGRAPSPAIGQI